MKKLEKISFSIINASLLCSVFLAVFYLKLDYNTPVSSSRNVALFLKEHKLDEKPVVITILSSAGAYLPKETCLMTPPRLECRRSTPWEDREWWRYHFGHVLKKKDDVNRMALQYVISKFGTLSGRTYVFNAPLTAPERKKYNLVPIAAFPGSYIESSWIYLTEKDLQKFGYDKDRPKSIKRP